MEQTIRRLRNRVANMILRAVVDRPGPRYQIQTVGDNARPDIQHMEPQGLHFRAPAGAEGLAVAPTNAPENTVLVLAQGDTPEDALAVGEGGLHYLGEFKVFLKANGEVHLAGGANFVALANLVNDRHDTIRADLTTLKNATNALAVVLDGIAPGTSTTFSGATSAVPQTLASVAASKVKAT